MSRPLYFAILVAAAFGSMSAWSAPLGRPQVEFSADAVVQTEEETMEQRLFSTPTKERREVLTRGGDGAVQIFRFDKNLLWQLMPSEKMYMEHGMGKNPSKDASQWDVTETVVGDEVLNGMKVTKYKTIATSTDGKKYGGFSWRTKEGISIKTDLLYKEGNEKHRMATELKNVKIGRQDPKLFEIPDGFSKFDMAEMMNRAMKDSKAQQSDEQKSDDGKAQASSPSGGREGESETRPDERSNMEKAGDALKKFLRR
jgi:hypothetical protein